MVHGGEGGRSRGEEGTRDKGEGGGVRMEGGERKGERGL